MGVVVSEHAWSPPAPNLRPFVAGHNGYRDRGVAPARHRGLPSPYLTFIVTLDDDLELLDARGRRSFSTDRAVAAGASISRPLHDTDHGSRDFSARDPEGNLWSFGTYRGHPG